MVSSLHMLSTPRALSRTKRICLPTWQRNSTLSLRCSSPCFSSSQM
ncbi:hypothetical protein GBAR_LOCUS21292 [Geodia barretti]|uniref:Uncharacterized protein n=1 Tax=Geodia barretti TaxID=519541 RepID=A0AA35WZ34_GEOBA|nr:hypothetical protein GBAR_LOCUS21292 [Geodia barretti]